MIYAISPLTLKGVAMLKLIWISFLLTLPLLMGCQSRWLGWYPQDNFIEEIAEDVIESKTGVDVDLSPFTPEK